MIKAQTDWFSIRTDAAGDEYVVSTGDEVLVVPLTDAGEVLLAVEPSPAFGVAVRVLPGGQVEPGLTLAEVANKELQEEIGFRAGRLDYLGAVQPWAKYLAVRSHLFLARDLTPSKLAGDEGYEISVAAMPLAELEAWIQAGRLRDARAIAGLFLARAYLEARESTSATPEVTRDD
jgi:ADP-ribose diphosphatase